MWFGAGWIDIGAELRKIYQVLSRIDRTTRRSLEEDMATNDELTEIGRQLDEAQNELQDLPGQIEALIAAAGDQADPALVASLREKATRLANIVPNAPAPVDPPVDPVPAPETAEQP